MIDRQALDALHAPMGRGDAVWGVTVGLVTNNHDPEHRARVKVKLPSLSLDLESAWAPVLTAMAGSGRGLHLLPEVGDSVLVAFEDGDVNRPFVLGAFWAGGQPPPETGDDAPLQRVLRSVSGHSIRLDDRKGHERIEIVDSSGKNRITLDPTDNSISVVASGPVKISAEGDVEIAANGTLKLSGKQVEVAADLKLAVTSQEQAELSAHGPLTVRGATVDIN